MSNPDISSTPKKLIFFVTEDWYFCSHRLDLAIAATQTGYDVSVVTQVSSHRDEILNAGITLIPIVLSRRSLNPWKELKLIYTLWNIYRKERPSIVHHVALKPVIYGAIAAKLSSVLLIVSAISGLGTVFSSGSKKNNWIKIFLKLALRTLLRGDKHQVIVQNPDDQLLLAKEMDINERKIHLIRGAGVDIAAFSPSNPPANASPIVTLAARMLWSKGVGVFVDAATVLKDRYPNALFVLVGDSDPENPDSVPTSQLQAWDSKGFVKWWGYRADMCDVYARSAIVCLPSSYGEGVPKCLIEAAACGRPIVTTNTPGCREIVKDGINGLLVPKNDVEALVVALEKLIKSEQLRLRLGRNGRNLVESEFSSNRVIGETLALYSVHPRCDK